MKEYSQVHRIISVIMIPVMMAELAGCAGYRVISNSSLSDYSGHKHIVYSEKSKYILDSTIVSNGILSGPIDSKQSAVKNAIHVYPLSSAGIKIDTLNILTLKIDQIKKVRAPGIYIPKEYVYTGPSNKPEREKEPAGKTIAKILYYVVGFSLVGSLSWMIFEKKRR